MPFTTDSGFGWHASPKTIGTVWFEGRRVVLSERGIPKLAARLAEGQPYEDAVRAVLYKDRDGSHDIVGWWTWRSPRNPQKTVGHLQICRTVEYGKVYYTATSTICDHTSTTLGHLLGRLTRTQAGILRRRREAKARDRETRQRLRQEIRDLKTQIRDLKEQVVDKRDHLLSLGGRATVSEGSR